MLFEIQRWGDLCWYHFYSSIQKSSKATISREERRGGGWGVGETKASCSKYNSKFVGFGCEKVPSQEMCSVRIPIG